MDKYKVIKKLGEGAYGVVVKCVNTETNEIVAIKKMKGKVLSWEECLNMREVKALRKLNNHPNLVKIMEMTRKNDELNIIFEYCDRNLDIKPENFLLKENDPDNTNNNNNMDKWTVKLGDFGLAKDMQEGKLNQQTEYVSTRWYRAPEPLFPGQSESDQLIKIVSVLGTPTYSEWSDGCKLAEQKGIQFPQLSATPLKSLIKNREISDEALDMLTKMLRYDCNQRLTAQQCLSHPNLRDVVNSSQRRLPNSSQRSRTVNQAFNNKAIPQNVLPQQSQVQNSYNIGDFKRQPSFTKDNNIDNNTSNAPIGMQQSSSIYGLQKNDSSLYTPSFGNLPSKKQTDTEFISDSPQKNSAYQPSDYGQNEKRMSKYGNFNLNNNNNFNTNYGAASKVLNKNVSSSSDFDFDTSSPYTMSHKVTSNKGNSVLQTQDPPKSNQYSIPVKSDQQSRKFTQLGNSLITGSSTNVPGISKIYNTSSPDALSKEIQNSQQTAVIGNNNFNTTGLNGGPNNMGGTNQRRKLFQADQNSSQMSNLIRENTPFGNNAYMMTGVGQQNSGITGNNYDNSSFLNRTKENSLTSAASTSQNAFNLNGLSASTAGTGMFQGLASRQIIGNGSLNINNNTLTSAINNNAYGGVGTSNIPSLGTGGRHQF